MRHTSQKLVPSADILALWQPVLVNRTTGKNELRGEAVKSLETQPDASRFHLMQNSEHSRLEQYLFAKCAKQENQYCENESIQPV